MIEGRVGEALNDYATIAGADREDLDIIARDAFSVLSASGHLEAAAEIGRMRLAEQPDDPVRRYLLDAVLGRSMEAAPTAYIETYFDLFAPQFDSKLTETLQYDAPREMVKLVAAHRSGFTHMLDLGCGTGLAAVDLRSLGDTLTGLDLSSGMLAQAQARGRYTELVKAEAAAYLAGAQSRFDLIFAADSLIYLRSASSVSTAPAIACSPPAASLIPSATLRRPPPTSPSWKPARALSASKPAARCPASTWSCRGGEGAEPAFRLKPAGRPPSS
jgi:predicted TPR repeat methyltransferase